MKKIIAGLLTILLGAPVYISQASHSVSLTLPSVDQVISKQPITFQWQYNVPLNEGDSAEVEVATKPDIDPNMEGNRFVSQNVRAGGIVDYPTNEFTYGINIAPSTYYWHVVVRSSHAGEDHFYSSEVRRLVIKAPPASDSKKRRKKGKYHTDLSLEANPDRFIVGHTTKLTATLMQEPTHRRLTGKKILFQVNKGRRWQSFKLSRANKKGRASVVVRPTRNTTYRALFRGDKLNLSSADSLTFRVIRD